MDKKSKISIGVGLIIIIALASILVYLYISGNKETNVITQGIIIPNNSNLEYNVRLLKNYNEYTKLLNDYDISDVVYLTNSSFIDNDYIVDFLLYEKDLEITDINLGLNDENNALDSILYYVNKKIDDSNEYLMYFIPVNKNIFSEVETVSKNIVESN